MRRRPPAGAGRSERGFALACLIALTLAIPGTSSADGLRREGTLDVEDGTALIVDTPRRRILEVGGGISPLSVRVYDGDTLARVGAQGFPGHYPQAGREGRARVQAFDPATRLLHVLAYATSVEFDQLVNPHLVSIDVDALEVRAVHPLVGVAPPGVRMLGLRLLGNGRALVLGQLIPGANPKVLFPVEAPRSTGALVAEIDLATGATTWGPHPIRGCQALITNQVQAAVGVTDDWLFVGCSAPQVYIVPVPGVPAIAAIRRADPSEQHMHFLPGSYATGDAYEDPVARRLLIVGAAPGRPAQAVWVFDLQHQAFVGQVAAGEANVEGAGLDPASGRLYVSISNAVLVTVDRGFEIPQAAEFTVPTMAGPVTPVGFNRSIVVRVREPDGTAGYGVFRDALADDAFVPGQPDDPATLDALTSDQPQYSANAQAFGMRVHEIGGVNALLQNVFPSTSNYWVVDTYGDQAGLALRDGDRKVTYSAVRRAHLSDAEASAEATASNPDANTSADYGTLARRTEAFDEDWPDVPAICSDFGGADDTRAQAKPGARVTCDHAKGSVTVEAARDVAPAGGGIAVGATTATTTIARDAKGALTVTATAEARDIVIGPSITIGRATATATGTAAGAKGTATARYTRAFEDVVAGDFRCSDQCDLAEVAAALTDAAGANLRVELPTFESVATPGGSHARARRETWAHRQDIVVNNLDPTETHVAALRVVLINDNTLASRGIVEFAAAGMDATVVRLVPPDPVQPEEPYDPEPVVVTDPPVERPAPPTTQPPPPPTAREPITRIVETLGNGWRLLTSGGGWVLARSILLWALLLLPLALFARARLLRDPLEDAR